MISDALAGKIDLIVTKSISRFARNTVDSLTTIRKLKAHGVECYFEKENIYTFDGKGELLLSIMSSIAQEESRSISENVTWGQRKRFADGKVSMPYKRFLGYEKGEDGTPVINPEQAAVVRLIFRLFLDGLTPFAICQELEKCGAVSPSGKEKWFASTVKNILQNERYKGDALLQKSYTADFLTKTVKKNRGEVQQYYVTGSHPAIISPEEFDLVQAEIKRRKEYGRSYSGIGLFQSKLVCAECGSFYGQKVWHSTDPYRKIVLHCNRKFAGEKCHTPTLTPEQIHNAFIQAYNTLVSNRSEIIANCELIRKTLRESAMPTEEKVRLAEEVTLVVELNKTLTQDKAFGRIPDEEYLEKRQQYLERYNSAIEKQALLTQKEEQIEQRDLELRHFIKQLSSRPTLLEKWDEQLWNQLVQRVMVHPNGQMHFHFRGDKVIQVKLPSRH